MHNMEHSRWSQWSYRYDAPAAPRSLVPHALVARIAWVRFWGFMEG